VTFNGHAGPIPRALRLLAAALVLLGDRPLAWIRHRSNHLGVP